MFSNCVCVCVCVPPVCEVVQNLQLASDRDRQDVVGDLSVLLDGLQVDAETFTSAEREHGDDLQTHRTFERDCLC